MLAAIWFKIFCLPAWHFKTNIKIYRTTVLPVVLYGCQAFCLTLGEYQMLRVFETGQWARFVGIMEGNSGEDCGNC
jgi:hypothetical protein